jgi:hypothetical protein
VLVSREYKTWMRSGCGGKVRSHRSIADVTVTDVVNDQCIQLRRL